VSSADRAYADECLGWAKKARTESERQILLEIAKTWLVAATLADRLDKIPHMRMDEAGRSTPPPATRLLS
jgi:hypothetical protein